jgi:hypothetical protein
MQINNMKSISQEDYSEKILKYYNIELKLKEDEIKRKRAFRDNARTKFGQEIKQIQNFITKNARLVSEVVLRERFQSIIEKVVVANNEIVARKEKDCDKDVKFLFAEWRKIKQEKMMLDKIKRAQRLEREEGSRRVLASKFPNLMGVLLTPFSIF